MITIKNEFPLLTKVAFNPMGVAKKYMGALTGSTVNRVRGVADNMYKSGRVTPGRQLAVEKAGETAFKNQQIARVGTAGGAGLLAGYAASRGNKQAQPAYGY